MTPIQPTHDYYATLKVCSDSLHDEIRASYLRLALLWHPDKNFGVQEATTQFQLISEAWGVLGDEGKRKEYDRIRMQGDSLSTSDASFAYRSQTDQQAPSTSTTEEEVNAQAENERVQQEFFDWEKAQQQDIQLCDEKLVQLDLDISTLECELADLKAKVVHDVPRWWELFKQISPQLADREEDKLKTEVLNELECEIEICEISIRIKHELFRAEESNMKHLSDEIILRRAQEQQRLAAQERKRKPKRNQAKQQAQEEARQRAADYARHCAEEIRARKTQEAEVQTAKQRKMEEEQAARKAFKERKAAERAHREQERRAEYAKAQKKNKGNRKSTHETVASAMKTGQHDAKQRVTAAESLCSHSKAWNVLDLTDDCPRCARRINFFPWQCPGCEIIACSSCLLVLTENGKATSTPDRQRQRRKLSKDGGGRQRTAAQACRDYQFSSSPSGSASDYDTRPYYSPSSSTSSWFTEEDEDFEWD